MVTSDHGENLGDHGHFRHVFSLYTSTVRVPLVLRLPGDQRAGEVRREAASLLDLFSTILEYCGVSIPPGQGRGRDLLGALPADDVPVFAEYYYPLQVLSTFEEAEIEALHPVLRGFMRRLRSVEVDGRRLVWSSDGQHALFDLRSDPSEQHNLRGAPEVAEVEAELESLLDAYAPKAGGGRSATPALGMDAQEPFRDVDPESRARLKELGYVR